MEWPARSPDLNPIEHVWDALGRGIAARPNAPLDIQQLSIALVEGGMPYHNNSFPASWKVWDRAAEHLLLLCDNRDSSREPFVYSLDTSLSEVLERPHICCERTPIGWNEDQFIEQDNILDILKQVYCRSITHFADFVAVSPELNLLEEKDRVTNTLSAVRKLKLFILLSVCSTNYCGVVLLMMVYNAYLSNCEGILFPHGFRYSLSQKRDDHEFNEFLQELVEYLHTNVATVFQEIQITAEEYALLKTIVIFSGVINLTDVGSSIVLRARRKYSALLSEYVVATRPDLSPSEQMMRLTRLFGVIPYIMLVTNAYNLGL
ncbi:unnamed protein product [Haemonchus placei]|uniref:NR LBD domain-containing protein n=1 Tax=Haemonchus placei TaxID=6290 RepID=A0A158QPS4_HAEPC|nr:unnamed protein product [Haemonchus placei]